MKFLFRKTVFKIKQVVIILFHTLNYLMVKLYFQTIVNLTLKESWSYFGNFINISQWDPNIESSVLHEKPNVESHIGEVYRLVCLMNGKPSTIDYVVKQYEKFKLLRLEGDNGTVTAEDIIEFTEMG